jgi:hypothetical protein
MSKSNKIENRRQAETTLVFKNMLKREHVSSLRSEKEKWIRMILMFAFSCFKHNFISHLIESVHINSFGKIDITGETVDNWRESANWTLLAVFDTAVYRKAYPCKFCSRYGSDRDTEISIPFCRFPLWSIALRVDMLPGDASAAYAWCGRNVCMCVHVSRRTFQSKRSGYWRGEELPYCMVRGCNESCWDFLRRMRR